MKSIKLLIILSIIFFFSQCSAKMFVSNPPFKVDKALYTKWYGGQPGARGVTLKLHLNNAAGIVFDSLFFQNKSTKVLVRAVETKIQLTGNYSTLNKIKRDFILNKNPSKELKNPFPSKQRFPFDLSESEAVLSYRRGSQTLYYKIKNISKGQSVSYPSAPKR